MTQTKQSAALSSMAVSAALTVAKAAVGVLTGSLAILSEAAHSLIDFGATVMTYAAVRMGDKPADEEHHYGHGKIESVSALAETGLLFVLSAVVFWESGKRLFGTEPAVVATLPAFAVIGGAIVVDFFRARMLHRIADKHKSHALEADALHFGTDMWSSVAVLLGLGGVALGFKQADALAAVAVAVFICIAGWRLGKRTVDTLTDTAPEGARDKIATAAKTVAGIISVDRIRARPVGKTLFVEIAVAVSRALPLDRVAALKTDVARAVRAEVDDAEVIVTTEPRALDDESVLERVMVIARNRVLAVHHVTVHHIGERLSVSLDLEVAGTLSLSKAHEIASGLEHALQEELGSDVEVETHIEPLEPQESTGRDAGAERLADIRNALADIEARSDSIGDMHDVRVRDTADGEIVNFHCHVDPALSVQDVHEHVDDVERALRKRFPTIKRVIGHAEPKGPV